jgi:PAS domain S-box-containing protein
MEVAILGGFAALGVVLAVAVLAARRAVMTERATADALRKQVRFSADVFDSLPIGLAMRDLQGRYVFVNRAWERFVGARREDVIGKTVHDRAPKAEADAVVLEDLAALRLGPGRSTELKDFVYGDKHYMLTRTVIADAAGAPLGVLIASVDTTERHAMQHALAIEQGRFELVVRAANVGILDWDGVTRTVYYSPRFKEILRHPRDADTSGWPDYFELVHPDDRRRVEGRFREHVLGNRKDLHETIEYRLRRADGTYVWIEAVGASVRDASGYVTRFIASIEDINERRFQEDALRSAVRLREEVERMSRHDLKTPLSSVIAMARLLREGARLARGDDELLAGIERAGHRILNMVNLSLDLFRMESGTYEFRPRPVDLAAVARRVAADLESQAASKGVRVDVSVAAKDGVASSAAQAEELLCYSMLANLIKNAIEAAPDGGAVTVSFKTDGQAGKPDTLLVGVHNAGAVPAEVQPRFFQKYATSGKSGGVGLGAYSARLMARVQAGDITLRTSQEEGTTLTVRLALAPQPQPASDGIREPVSGTSKKISSGSRRVLVVDDDEFNRLVLRRSLPNPPFAVEEAVNGRAALEAARRAWPDTVLLDLEMPVMDGHETARHLRSLERDAGRPRCTIIAISSNDDPAIVKRALAAGCDRYLVKPAPREALLKLLDAEVLLDPDLRASLPAFLDSRRRMLDEMPGSLAGGDRVRFRRLAHKLAGSFVLYGFGWAAEQCRGLERDAAAGDVADLARGVAAVRAHLDSVAIK